MLSAGNRLGSYEILAPLGAGGMGEVYRARDTRLGREVAIKVVPAEVASDPSRLKRFEKEARSASALNHPNIITIYDIGVVDSVSYIAMEKVDGKTLKEMLFSGPLAMKKLLQISPQIADGLARAHDAGIVHRDLKPENVMVTKDGLVKILDFGLAKLTQMDSSDEGSDLPTETATSPGVVLGTVGYMSPEQASGTLVDFRSDQFSFGSVLYEITTGRKAFVRKTAAETLSAIIRDDPEPLARLRPEVPPPLRWIVERCMAKQPEERYASTRDLARDLGSVRDHISEVSSGAQSFAGAPLRGKRHLFPVLAAAGLLLLGALLLALIAPGLGWKAAASAPSFHRLTFRHGEIHYARFAPDGQTIFYGATWEGEPTRVYMTRPESPESRPFDFGDEKADILAISPSGEMAILISPQILARVPVAGGIPRKVLEGVAYASADWAPNGKDMVVTHRVDGKIRLEFPIGKPIRDGPIFGPRFSPAGDRIAVVEENHLAVIDFSGNAKSILPLSGNAEIAGVPCWRPDGREIWFTATEPGKTPALYAVNLAGKRRLVTRVPGQLELDDISRDGRVLAAHHTVVRVVMGVVAEQERDRDLSWLDQSIPADLSSDGKTVVLNEAGEGSGSTPAVYLRRTDGSPAVRLGEGSGLALSPDGRWVLAGVVPGGGKPAQLVLLPTGPGEPKTIENDQFSSFSAAAWLPDGKRIVFTGEEKNHDLHIYLQDLEGGRPRRITSERAWIKPATNPVSADGRFVIGMRSDGNDAALYPIEGGQARPVAGLEPGDVPLQWSGDGHSLYVRARAGVPVKIWRLEPTSGQKQLALEIRPGDPAIHMLQQLLISRDGKSYVYGSPRITSALYLVEGLR
jgi:Tol biopolymer transport system component